MIISYYWPPLGGPGSLRPVKFSKYLPEFGITPTVLTRKNIAYHSIDEELIKDAGDIKTIRTESLDPARLLYLFGMRIYRPRIWQKPIKRSLNFPDHKIAWLPFAYNAGIKLDFDRIFVTAPPFSSFIIAYLIAKKTGKPLILDFRDAWIEFPFLPYTRLQKKFVAYWEKKLTDFAPLIIAVDENIKTSLIKRYPQIEKKISVIPNGYDPDDFMVSEKPDVFTIAYLGTVREERDPTNFLNAVEKLIEEKNLSPDDVEVKFIGHIEELFLNKIKKYTFTRVYGHLPYKKALKEFSSSHLALMTTTGSSYFFPSRQNEYLASHLPVIICGKSRGLHLLEYAFKRGYPGWFYGFNDIDGMKKKLIELYSAFKKGTILRGETPYRQYTRRALTEKLAGLIKRIPL